MKIYRQLGLLLAMAGCWQIQIATASPSANTNSAAKFVTQGDHFRSQNKLSAALWAYRQAAKAGSPEGCLAAGDLLVNQGKSSRGRRRILDLSGGLQYIFRAATNRQARACAELSDALQNGLGVHTNLTSAYAWLQVATKIDPSFKPALDELAVQIDPGQILQAQNMARDYLAGHWPARVARAVDQGDAQLQVQGMSTSGRRKLVILNGESLAQGDSANMVPLTNGRPDTGHELTVTCRQIGSDYILVSVAGDPDLKMLSM